MDNVHVFAAKRTSGHSPLERDLEMKNTMQVYLTNAVQHVINNINSTWWYDFFLFCLFIQDNKLFLSSLKFQYQSTTYRKTNPEISIRVIIPRKAK